MLQISRPIAIAAFLLAATAPSFFAAPCRARRKVLGGVMARVLVLARYRTPDGIDGEEARNRRRVDWVWRPGFYRAAGTAAGSALSGPRPHGNV